MSGAVPPPAARPLGRVAGGPRPVCPGCGRCGRGDPAPASQRAPLRAGVARCGGGGRASPGGGAFHCCEGRLRSGAPPPPTALPLGGLSGSATHVLWARVCGCRGPALSPWPARPVGAACRGGGGGPSPGGGVACHRCEGRLGSGPPPAARPLGWLSGSATHVPSARVCGRGSPSPDPWLARVPCGRLLATGVAQGVWVQAPPLPCCPPPGRAAGARWPRAVGAAVGMCGVCGVCGVRVVVPGAAFLLSLWCAPLWCFGAVLCPPRAVCLPCSLPCARPLLGCGLPLVSFVASPLFTLSSARPSPWHALFPCLRPGVCLCLFPRWLVVLSFWAL